ncbi:ABC transporter ATP-binding protein [Bifidobacterium biavatii]|uniref:Diguanylate cyclase n=1 Tax=Bifidobacterium biavatii DSM 23969 TaxID=1437608 RepID=A0A087A1Z0_9BIFI|nr:ABC transporter ATP-binding protein [Bifidobacterium biavatii]KFI52790.1 diguanylate cyclase [Bifidobacterium biavatii DSM 23969]
MSVEVRGLHVTIGGKTIVRGVDLSVAEGERVGLVGSSGSGKSMISRAIMGLLPANARVSGSIMVGDRQVVCAPDVALADLRGRYMGMVFQNPGSSLNPVMTVARQVALPLRLHYDLTKAERLDRVRAMIAKVGLPDDVLGKYPHQLSGGQQQRVGIATALITSPRFIIADEPTTALDSIVQRQIVDLLVSLVDDAGASMLFITHDFAVLAHATTRCYVLDDGAIADSGDTAALLAHPTTPAASHLVSAARTLSLNASACAADSGNTAGGASAPSAEGAVSRRLTGGAYTQPPQHQ